MARVVRTIKVNSNGVPILSPYGGILSERPADATLASPANAPVASLIAYSVQPAGDGSSIRITGTLDVTANIHDGLAIQGSSNNSSFADRRFPTTQILFTSTTGTVEFEVAAGTVREGENLILRVAGVKDLGGDVYDVGPFRRVSGDNIVISEPGTPTVVTLPVMYSAGSNPQTLRVGLPVAFTEGEFTDDDPSLRHVYGQVSDDSFTSNIIDYEADEVIDGAHEGFDARVAVQMYDTSGTAAALHLGAAQASPVAAAPTPSGGSPSAFDSDDIEVSIQTHPVQGVGVVAFRILDSAKNAATTRVFCTVQNPAPTTTPGGEGWQWCNEFNIGGVDYWLRDGRSNDGAWRSWLEHTNSVNDSFILVRTETATSTPAESADYSAPSIPYAYPAGGGGGTGEPGPSPGQTGARAHPRRTRAEWQINHPTGDGMQQMLSASQCQAFPSVIYIGQDVAGLRATFDGGKHQVQPRGIGLPLEQCHGVACDPVQPRRVLVYQGAVALWPASANLTGISFSKDWGDHFERLTQQNGDMFADTHDQSASVCFMPHSAVGSGDTAYCSVAYGVHSRNETTGDLQFYRFVFNASGHVSTALVGTLSRATFGSIREMCGHPTKDELYFSTSNGLIKMSNPSAGTGISNILSGSTKSKLYFTVGNSAQATIGSGTRCMRSNNMNNASPTFSQVGGTLSRLDKLYVNVRNPSRMFYSTPDSSGTSGNSDQHLRSTDDNWATTLIAPNTAAGYEPRPGSGLLRNQMNICYQHNHGFYTNPANDDEFMAYCCHKQRGNSQTDWRTTDSGRTFKISIDGNNGASCNGGGMQYALANKNLYYQPGLDGGGDITNDGGASFALVQMNKDSLNNGGAKFATLHSTACGGALVPLTNGRYRIVMGLGRSNRGMLIVKEFNPTTLDMTEFLNYAPFPSADRERIHFPCYDTNAPQHVWAGKYYNDNYGHQSNWVNISGQNWPGDPFVIAGMSQHDPNSQGQWAYATNGNSTQRGQLYHRRSRSNNWALINVGWQFVGSLANDYPFCAHPRNRDLAYIQTSDRRNLVEINGNTGAKTQLNLNVPANEEFAIGIIAVDARFPQWILVRAVTLGTEYGLLMYNRSTGAVTNLTHLTATFSPNYAAIHPLTGNIFCGGSQGSDILSPLYSEPQDFILDATKKFPPSSRVTATIVEALWAAANS